jgi:hypothetical protein
MTQVDWQPIAAANRDGTVYLLYSDRPKTRYPMVLGKWNAKFNHWQSEPGAWPVYPTHCAPKPSPPK